MTRTTPLILAVALFMEQMDSTVIATSLPAIAADLGTSPVALKLAVTSYLVALAIFIPISGWMSDRFGAKNIFRLAIVVFRLVTFVTAVGALSSKFMAQWVFRSFGFRNVLGTGTALSAAIIAVNALFTPAAVIMAFLLVGGVLRSICFTGVNAMVFSDIDEGDMSQATAITSVAQQISLATDVALAGGVRDIAGQFHGGGLALGDFHIAFVAVAVVSGLATFTFFRLPPDAGAAVSGHRRHLATAPG